MRNSCSGKGATKSATAKRRSRESGVAIYLTTAMLVMIIPTIGLTIDGSLLYVIKCRMQGAVDGAALAGARALARGNNSSQQITNAQNDAATFVKLNFPSSYFFSSDATVVPTTCLLYTSPSPRDRTRSRMPSSA